VTHDSQLKTHDYGTKDRGVHSGHAANALAGMVDLGDAPSCHLCGAIMTRNGSCYRCMECGSTSGCS
jgi:ribonucleoside-diphosphate reductase alpha chain